MNDLNEGYNYFDYVDEYSGIPIYERQKNSNVDYQLYQLSFDFDTPTTFTYDKLSVMEVA